MTSKCCARIFLLSSSLRAEHPGHRHWRPVAKDGSSAGHCGRRRDALPSTPGTWRPVAKNGFFAMAGTPPGAALNSRHRSRAGPGRDASAFAAGADGWAMVRSNRGRNVASSPREELAALASKGRDRCFREAGLSPTGSRVQRTV
nr:unnamed protein product [Digitaria exilis]